MSGLLEDKTEDKKFKLKIFTDDNLQEIISKGWNIDLLIKGQMKTLTSKTFFVEVTEMTTIKELKCIIEDQEGYDRKHQYIKKRSKFLEDHKTLFDYFVNEKETLLLINPAKKKHVKDVDSKVNKMSTKTKQKAGATQTMIISESDAKKLSDKDWFEDPENYLLSGPQNQPQTPKTPTSASTIQTFSFVNTLGGSKTDEEEDQREKVRKATEARLKKFQK
jgi:hypothetical protein